jgi:hypothetical protein
MPEAGQEGVKQRAEEHEEILGDDGSVCSVDLGMTSWRHISTYVKTYELYNLNLKCILHANYTSIKLKKIMMSSAFWIYSPSPLPQSCTQV